MFWHSLELCQGRSGIDIRGKNSLEKEGFAIRMGCPPSHRIDSMILWNSYNNSKNIFRTWNLHVYGKDLYFNTRGEAVIKQLYLAFVTFWMMLDCHFPKFLGTMIIPAITLQSPPWWGCVVYMLQPHMPCRPLPVHDGTQQLYSFREGTLNCVLRVKANTVSCTANFYGLMKAFSVVLACPQLPHPGKTKVLR